ncbi:unnamed protein product [Miscanthus lutarioriparius]|uniref:Thaumatin-like protein n=1 Tax=Miscanthus lutarioriparius TaxID=422564 RepID=A0A811R9I9_9POAL|nr:unnamed protein product [Miscanthus lutarioriparius]
MAGGSRSRRPAAALSLLLLGLVALITAGKASAATFQVTNICPFMVWPAAIPAGGGTQLEPGQTWLFKVPAGTGGRVWGRTGCRFAPSGHGWCASGDCAGALRCQLSGKAPATLAEFTIGGVADFYLSVVDGFNLPIDFRCDGEVHTIRCRNPGCPDANHHPGEGKVRRCKADSDYHVVFCPK